MGSLLPRKSGRRQPLALKLPFSQCFGHYRRQERLSLWPGLACVLDIQHRQLAVGMPHFMLRAKLGKLLLSFPLWRDESLITSDCSSFEHFCCLGTTGLAALLSTVLFNGVFVADATFIANATKVLVARLALSPGLTHFVLLWRCCCCFCSPPPPESPQVGSCFGAWAGLGLNPPASASCNCVCVHACRSVKKGRTMTETCGERLRSGILTRNE